MNKQKIIKEIKTLLAKKPITTTCECGCCFYENNIKVGQCGLSQCDHPHCMTLEGTRVISKHL